MAGRPWLVDVRFQWFGADIVILEIPKGIDIRSGLQKRWFE